ncbi:MAG: DNA-processing protein DprA [Dermatophilaceae bacterium]|nr:DNA-processing protein DprA [Intrasporangiaceae bacterium]
MSAGLPAEDRTARIALSRLGEPGNPGIHDAVTRWGSVEALRRLVSGAASAKGVVPERFSAGQLAQDLRHSDQIEACVVIPSDATWPLQLRDLEVPPLCLWMLGPADLAEASERSVAIVGARSATAYGAQVAADLAVGLCQRGFAIVSGAAFGIDAAAHRGALAVGGVTVAVLAGGIDRLYPASHTQLLREIGRTGAVVTEQPPGVAPIGSRFLGRNRIIAALANGTVVVEASLRSGSLNTAGHALKIHRPVGAVPGPVTSMQSAGCHAFVRDHGATIVTDAAEVADLVGRIGLDLAPVKRGVVRPSDDLDPADRALFEVLPLRSFADIADLARAASLSERAVRAGLGRLEMRGDAVTDGLDGWRKAQVNTRPGR